MSRYETAVGVLPGAWDNLGASVAARERHPLLGHAQRRRGGSREASSPMGRAAARELRPHH